MSTYATLLQSNTLYVRDLQVSNNATTPNTKLDIAAGSCRDSGNQFDMVNGATITLDASVNGVNGLDTGSFAASKVYAVYLIADPTQLDANGNLSRVATVMSLSLTGPLMPSSATANYGVYRLIGFAVSDGSTHFDLMYTIGRNNDRTFMYQTLQATSITAGAATSLTAVALTAFVPAIDSVGVTLNVAYTPATAGDKVSITPYGSTATTLSYIVGSVAAKANNGEIRTVAKLNSSAPTIQYINSAASGSTAISVSSFNYSL